MASESEEHLINLCSQQLEVALSETDDAKRRAVASAGLSPSDMDVCSRAALRKQLIAAVEQCTARLAKDLWMDRLLHAGDFLLNIAEYDAANCLCYRRCIEDGVTTGFPDDESLTRDVRAAYGSALCRFHMLVQQDPSMKCVAVAPSRHTPRTRARRSRPRSACDPHGLTPFAMRSDCTGFRRP